MNRYCSKCCKEFDFPIKSLSQLENLICPVCGTKISRNSRAPVDSWATERTEDAIGKTILILSKISFLLYSSLSCVAVVAFFLHQDKILYIMTGICLSIFLLQKLFGFCTFRTGTIFLPLGAAIGYFVFRSIQGACLGVSIVFIIRKILWNIFFYLLGKFLNFSGGPGAK